MSQGVGLGLFHHVGSMGLDGQCTGPEFIGDLLVEQSGDHQVQHFSFARG